MLTLAVVMLLAVVVAADCTREIIWLGTSNYGGEQYNNWVSCGSSAGNFGYTCDSYGRCYENPTIDASQYCHCDDSGGGGGHPPILSKKQEYLDFTHLFLFRSRTANLYISQRSLVQWPFFYSLEIRDEGFRQEAKLP